MDPLVLIAAWKKPQNLDAFLAFSDPRLSGTRKEAAALIGEAPPQQLAARLTELSSAQRQRFQLWAANRYGAHWYQLAPAFQRFLAGDWNADERQDPPLPLPESTDPQTGSG